MKTAKLTATLDIFTRCPYCNDQYETNMEGVHTCNNCGKKFNIEFDPFYFSAVASYSICKVEDYLSPKSPKS